MYVCLMNFLQSIKHTTGKEKKRLSSTVTLVLVDGTDACQNASVNSTTTTKTVKSIHCNQTCVNTTTTEMLLHNNSLKYVQVLNL